MDEEEPHQYPEIHVTTEKKTKVQQQTDWSNGRAVEMFKKSLENVCNIDKIRTVENNIYNQEPPHDDDKTINFDEEEDDDDDSDNEENVVDYDDEQIDESDESDEYDISDEEEEDDQQEQFRLVEDEKERKRMREFEEKRLKEEKLKALHKDLKEQHERAAQLRISAPNSNELPPQCFFRWYSEQPPMTTSQLENYVMNTKQTLDHVEQVSKMISAKETAFSFYLQFFKFLETLSKTLPIGLKLDGISKSILKSKTMYERPLMSVWRHYMGDTYSEMSPLVELGILTGSAIYNYHQHQVKTDERKNKMSPEELDRLIEARVEERLKARKEKPPPPQTPVSKTKHPKTPKKNITVKKLHHRKGLDLRSKHLH